MVYRGESISRFIAHGCGIPHPAKYSVPFPSFALRWSSTSISFALPARSALCKITDYPAIVKIPPVAVGVLAAGGSSQVPFHVSLECESGAVSSPRPTISAANIAM
ncbi:fimbrial protein, partial [Salmonella enterica subsp. enterica]|nr:fimbrial protein [Salmonella enterica subsp. enterica serovar Virchow]EDT2129542.1 fimbrial protein [Salmonella enterica subsp. enterica]